MSDLTREEREALRVAYRGPWGDAMVPTAPPRLLETVANLLTAREQAAYERGAAEVRARVAAEREGFLQSDNLDRAWIAGWHSAIDWALYKTATLDADPSPSADDEGVAR